MAAQTVIPHIAPALPVDQLLAGDMFSGGGGASEGISQAGLPVAVAVNHCPKAIAMHRANHPATAHYEQSIYDVDPRRATAGQPLDLLWASPSCTHFSRARGGVPVSAQLRGLGWMVLKWASQTQARVVIVENVPEWQTWGPVRRTRPVAAQRGRYFRQFIQQLEWLGYTVEWRILSACDYGAPTTRRRLYLIARKDAAPVWPAPTHGPDLQPYRSAAECIDWSDLGTSIFARKRPLAAATCRRIAHGIVRYVIEAAEPYIIRIGQTGDDAGKVRSLHDPLTTITTKNEHCLVSAFIAKHYGGVVGHGPSRPLGTITAKDHHSLVTAFMINTRNGERPGQAPRCHDPRAPWGTVTATGSQGAMVAAFLTSYYGQGKTGADPREPMPTVVTKARHGLVTVDIDGQTYAITDIRMRMLTPRELARAQGFPDTYILTGSKADQIARIGNSVCPPVARALVAANRKESA